MKQEIKDEQMCHSNFKSYLDEIKFEWKKNYFLFFYLLKNYIILLNIFEHEYINYFNYNNKNNKIKLILKILSFKFNLIYTIVKIIMTYLLIY